VHLTWTGMQMRTPEVARARSAEELLEVVRAIADARQAPTLVEGFDESTWDRRDLPSLADLDALGPLPVALVRVDGHVTLANSAALEASGALAEDGADRSDDGLPTGRVTRRANDAVQRWFEANLEDRDVEELQLMGAALAASHGVTTIHEMSEGQTGGIRDLDVLLRHRSRLPVDVVPYLATTDLSAAMDRGLPRVGGDLPVDGSIGARTAWVSAPYVDTTESVSGYLSDDALARFLADGHLAGLQVAVHAIGDAAIEQVVRMWEQVYQSLDSRGRRHFRARRHRIEHYEMPGPDVLERTAMLGLAACVQPSFDAAWGRPGGLYEQRLGWDRASRMNPFTDMLERGIEVGAGSDSPVTTIDPLAGIAAFGSHHDPSERLSRHEAIRLYTLGSARLAHQEDKKGSLEPGKHADFAAYDVDLLAAEDLQGVRPILTVSLGRDVHAD
jgi:hypothetical protein